MPPKAIVDQKTNTRSTENDVPDPEWLAKARAEGRIKEHGVNQHAITPESTGPNLVNLFGLLVPGCSSEKEFQKLVIDFAHRFGWRVAHFRTVQVKDSKGTHWETPVAADGDGFPDLELVRGKRLFKAELKFGKNQRTPEQVAWGNAYTEAGIEYYCWYPHDWQEIASIITGAT